MNEFDKLTLELTKKLTLTEKKEYGIYFIFLKKKRIFHLV